MELKDYFQSPWAIHYNVDTTPGDGFSKKSCTKMAFTTITNEFESILDNLYDAGAAIITNTMKRIPNLTNYLESVGREGPCIVATFKNDEVCGDLKEDEMFCMLNNLFEQIIHTIDKWGYALSPNTTVPLYNSGNRYKPDAMYGLIDDVAVLYDRLHCTYSIIFDPTMYELYVAPHMKYYKYIMCGIMKANKIRLYNQGSTLIVVDKNNGDGATFDRANAIACAAMFAASTVFQTMNLKEGN